MGRFDCILKKKFFIELCINVILWCLSWISERHKIRQLYQVPSTNDQSFTVWVNQVCSFSCCISFIISVVYVKGSLPSWISDRYVTIVEDNPKIHLSSVVSKRYGNATTK